MELLMIFLVFPIVGMLWFINLAYLIKNLIKEKDTRNQMIIGSFLSLLFAIMLVLCISAIVEYR